MSSLCQCTVIITLICVLSQGSVFDVQEQLPASEAKRQKQMVNAPKISSVPLWYYATILCSSVPIFVLKTNRLVHQVHGLPQLCQSVSHEEPKEEAHRRKTSISNKTCCSLRFQQNICTSKSQKSPCLQLWWAFVWFGCQTLSLALNGVTSI